MLLVSLADQYYFDLVCSFQFEISSECLTIGNLGKPEMHYILIHVFIKLNFLKHGVMTHVRMLLGSQ